MIQSFSSSGTVLRIPSHREPVHPGEILLEEFLSPMKITQRQLATAIHVPYQRVRELINRRQGISPGTALRLAQFFGNSSDFWMKLQMRWDLFQAHQSEAEVLASVKRYNQV